MVRRSRRKRAIRSCRRIGHYLGDVSSGAGLKHNVCIAFSGVLLCRTSCEKPRPRVGRGLSSLSSYSSSSCPLAPWIPAQDKGDKPIPILTGNIGTFSFVSGGQNLIDTQINPVLLVPLGDRWLIESRAEFEGEFQRPPGGGPYGGPVDKHVDYAQVDYIANPYLTVTAGRFLTPFGIFNERLYPVWIRFLQPDPLILPIRTAPSDGAMFRGGFPVSAQANMNYAPVRLGDQHRHRKRGFRTACRRTHGILLSRTRGSKSAVRGRRLCRTIARTPSASTWAGSRRRCR